jgi:hypothetical protein
VLNFRSAELLTAEAISGDRIVPEYIDNSRHYIDEYNHGVLSDNTMSRSAGNGHIKQFNEQRLPPDPAGIPP